MFSLSLVTVTFQDEDIIVASTPQLELLEPLSIIQAPEPIYNLNINFLDGRPPTEYEQFFDLFCR